MRKGTNVGLELRKGAWTAEEDMLLKECIEKHGEGKWHLVPLKAGLNRCRKSCRLRWLNYLRPNIKRGDFAEDEVDLILRLHKLLGNRWSLIAGRIPGRTANDVKNYWNTHLRSGSNSKQRKKESNNELIQDNRDTIIKHQPRTFSKTQNSYVGDKACINVSSGLISSPNALDNTIDKYLDDLFDDREMETNGEVGWSFGGSSTEGMGLMVVEEEEDDHISLFDFPMDEAMLDVINSYQL